MQQQQEAFIKKTIIPPNYGLVFVGEIREII